MSKNFKNLENYYLKNDNGFFKDFYKSSKFDFLVSYEVSFNKNFNEIRLKIYFGILESSKEIYNLTDIHEVIKILEEA